MGAYGATAPYNCPKTMRILAEALAYLDQHEPKLDGYGVKAMTGCRFTRSLLMMAACAACSQDGELADEDEEVPPKNIPRVEAENLGEFQLCGADNNLFCRCLAESRRSAPSKSPEFLKPSKGLGNCEAPSAPV